MGDLWKVDIHVGGIVEVVGEYIQRNMCDDLGNLSFGETCASRGRVIRFADLALGIEYALGEGQGRRCLWTGTLSLAAGDDLVVLQPDHLADCGMCRQAVTTVIFLCRQQGKIFTDFRIQQTTGKRR